MHAASLFTYCFWQNSRVELGEDNDGEEDNDEEDGGEGIYVQRRVVANPFPKRFSTHQDESLVIFSCILKTYLNVFLFICF
jgi:hypothetical protein